VAKQKLRRYTVVPLKETCEDPLDSGEVPSGSTEEGGNEIWIEASYTPPACRLAGDHEPPEDMNEFITRLLTDLSNPLPRRKTHA